MTNDYLDMYFNTKGAAGWVISVYSHLRVLTRNYDKKEKQYYKNVSQYGKRI